MISWECIATMGFLTIIIWLKKQCWQWQSEATMWKYAMMPYNSSGSVAF
jgi:hypothetical protein